MATLVTLRGPDAGQSFALEGSPIIIGRQQDSNIHLEATAVSRQHAQIVRDNGEFFVEDLDSSNGTYVNGKRIRGRQELTEEDTLQIGPYLFVLRPEPPSGPIITPDRLVIRDQVKAAPSNQTLYSQNAAHKLQVVLEISQHLAKTLEAEPLLNKLLDHLLRMFPQADRGLVLLSEDDQLFVRGRGDKQPISSSYSRTVVNRALEEGVGLLSEDVEADTRFASSQTLTNLKLRSFLCVPMIGSDGRRLGIIQLDRSRAGTTFHSHDLQLLTAVGMQAALVLENVALHAQSLREERLRQELKLAREIQQGFLPDNFRPLGDAGFELYARVHPARGVSGDLYDFFPLGDGRLAFFLGDVSGKGMPAALFMVAVHTLCRHLAADDGSPAQTLAKLNAALAANNPSAMFVTLVHGIYDPRTGEVVLASGGHPSPLLRRSDGSVEIVDLPNGRLLGYGEPNLQLNDRRLTLRPGEMLIFYTDGFTEAKENDGQTMFGVEGLRQFFASLDGKISLEAAATEAKSALERFIGSSEQQDDMTLLLLRRTQI